MSRPSVPPAGRPHLACIGAGVAGLSGSLALARAGFRTSIFERAERSRDSGGPLWLPANAVRALKSLGAFDGIREQTTELRRYSVLDDSRRRIFNLPVDLLQRKYGEALQVVQRRDLLQALKSKLPNTPIYYHHPCVGARRWHAGLSLVFRSGTTPAPELGGRLFDGVVAADGFHSTLRRTLNGESPLEPVSGWIWTGLADLPESDLRRPGEAELIAGQAQTFLSLPLRQESDSASRKVAWWAASAHHDASSRHRLPQLGQAVRDILKRTQDDSRMEFAIRDRAVAAKWSFGPITLLGDAAHPMTPALGQGASQAIEGAVVLGQCLQQHPNDLPRAFGLYEQRRRSRVARVVRFARYLGAGLTLPLPNVLRRWVTWSALPALFGELDGMLRHQEMDR